MTEHNAANNRPMPPPGSPFGPPPDRPAIPEYDELGLGGGTPSWLCVFIIVGLLVVVVLLVPGR